MTNRKYTEEQRAWLKAYIPGHHHADTARAFTEKWPDKPMTKDQARCYSENHHIPCGMRFDGHPSKYPDEARKFIEDNCKGRGNVELWQMLCDRFGPVMTLKQLRSYKKRNMLGSGLTGRFQKGCVPENKGKTWDEYMSKEAQEKARRTCFKKGHIPKNHMPVGTIAKTTDGYMVRKIGEPDEWEFIHRATWEEHHGPIPEGMCVIFKDGNKENCDINNLALISRTENAIINRKHLRYDDPDLTEAGILIAKVLTAAAAAEGKANSKKTTREKNSCA